DTDYILVGKEVSGTYNPVHSSDGALGGAYAGDKIMFQFDENLSKVFKIKGVFGTGFPDTDFNSFITVRAYEELYGKLEKATRIKIKLTGSGMEDTFEQKLIDMGIQGDISAGSELAGMEMTDAFTIIKTIMAVVAILVSMTTLFIVIYINAVNRRKLIAIIKAIGVKRRIVIISFMLQSLFYALSGVVFGMIVLYSVLVPYFAANPLMMPFGTVPLYVKLHSILPLLIAFVVFSLITGFVPAYQVANRNIIETMRS
ncbi:FtsX-like permease family protein, partial [Candidatus Woesearchaeota archaeon]|nr:FtsX-like permease family protein [Candidatus Woesearchaeota archaeon]